MNIANPRLSDNASIYSWLRLVRMSGAIVALAFLHLILLGLSYSQTAFVLAPIREQSQIFGVLHTLGVIITTVLACPLVYPATQSPLLPGIIVLNSFVWGVGLYTAIKYYAQFRQQRTAAGSGIHAKSP